MKLREKETGRIYDAALELDLPGTCGNPELVVRTHWDTAEALLLFAGEAGNKFELAHASPDEMRDLHTAGYFRSDR